MFALLKKELSSFSSSERIFLFCALLCGFCITADYAIIRPVSNAVLLSGHGSKAFAWAWLAILPLNFIVVALYNRYLPRLGCLKVFLISVGAILGMNVFCALFLKQIASLSFFFYLWKEVYVMLMFQQLWSVIHATVKIERAKYLYGLIFAVGGAGGILGSAISGFLAVHFGSENLLFGTIPIYLVLALAYCTMLKHAHTVPKNEWGSQGSLLDSIKLVSSSRLLMFILLIVLFMQVSSTLIYYQFNESLEAAIGDKDLRTEYCGRVLGIVQIATVGLQLIGSFLIVHFLGIKRSHLLVPAVLGLNAFSSLLFPTFPVISLAFITIKSFDFSLFGVLRELLYVPLKLDEKFRAKALIDVFVYRSSKAVASLLILSLEVLDFIRFLPWTILGIYLIWGLTAQRMFRKEESLPTAPEET